MQVGDLVKFKWQEIWNKYSSSEGKADWHKRYDRYYGVVYKINESETKVMVRWPDKTNALPIEDVEVISKCQKN